MIPAKIEDVFLQIITNFSGVILDISAGTFLKNEFQLQTIIYKNCPFLEGTLEALEINNPFLLEGMLMVADSKEYNVDIELFKSDINITILIHNRTSVYKYVSQLNQNRNDLFFLQRELAEKNKELDRLRKIADKANEEKSRFLAIMSHEIRNPLNVILGYSEMISEENINDAVKEYAKLLSVSGQNLKIIVNDILDLSRIEAGKFALVSQLISIKEIAENCIENYQFQNKNTAVVISLKVAKNVPKALLGDDVRLHQILSNLLSNSLKFTEKGKISLQISLLSEAKKNATISFIVSDTGRGMTSEQASKIFNEYQQNKLSDNRVFGGAGLGLSIVKRLLEAMNGKISVESEIDKGTTFKVEIPFEKLADSSKKSNQILKKSKKISLKGKRILVADDDVLNLSIVNHILNKEAVKLTQAKDGLEALKLLKSNIFDLVLLDIRMPNITGEALVQLKKEFKKENKKIPFLALTANTTSKDRDRYTEIGFVDVISKPYSAIEFTNKIQENL